MKYFLDSAIVEDIIYAYKNWGIDGVTTNPKHIKTSGKPFLKVIKEIADVTAGADIVTAGFDIFKSSFDRAFTDRGIGIFTKAWDDTV